MVASNQTDARPGAHPVSVIRYLVEGHAKMGMTPTALSVYTDWLKEHLNLTEWGRVSISFTICNGQVTDVACESVETKHFPMKPKQ